MNTLILLSIVVAMAVLSTSRAAENRCTFGSNEDETTPAFMVKSACCTQIQIESLDHSIGFNNRMGDRFGVVSGRSLEELTRAKLLNEESLAAGKAKYKKKTGSELTMPPDCHADSGAFPKGASAAALFQGACDYQSSSTTIRPMFEREEKVAKASGKVVTNMGFTLAQQLLRAEDAIAEAKARYKAAAGKEMDLGHCKSSH